MPTLIEIAFGAVSLALLGHMALKLENIMSILDTLKADVAAQTTVVNSAITLLSGLKTSLDEAIAANDPAALTALSASLDSETTALAAAVTANTPAAPPTP